ncbi:hypothetical protein D0P01_23555, partial [Salmonella enterica]|nr:hypothetical protein [Salmonella enterica]
IISIADDVNKKMRVLCTDDEFEKWYQEQYDFSMFSEWEVKQAIQDDKPENYPCIPLIIKENNELLYLSKELILQCVGRIFNREVQENK